MRAGTTLPLSPAQGRKGQPIAGVPEGWSPNCPRRCPQENHHWQLRSIGTQTSPEPRFRPLLPAPLRRRRTLQEEQGGPAWGKLRAERRRPRPRAALDCAGLPPRPPPRAWRPASVPGAPGPTRARAPAPGLGGGRGGGGHVLGRGLHLATPRALSGLARPGWATRRAPGAWAPRTLRRKAVRCCRRGGGLQTRAGLPPRLPAQLRARRCLPPCARPPSARLPRARLPRRGGRAEGGAAARADLREGTWAPPLPAGRLPAAARPPGAPEAKPAAPLGRPAPPAAPPLPRGRPENPERGSAARPGRAAALGMLSSRGRFFGRK
ncbi:nascent polypeptide-associated complex subunit alpha, muscle-specific form-like [Camelus ferus]|uniref:Nascent polypeptide-associated complex subunit alpha, muscle-specific form-like n=1 Tax=Camelus ferus TaxID=419612 RepID=A0A8B8RQB9_CAMFR|nr:nascent polypeptide-associated complex subunit alpha, muscle-specific form-like [Camelus ferus]